MADDTHLIEWWNNGADGQIDWGTHGDFEQCVALAGKYVDDPEGFCNERHQDAVGGPPGSEGKRMMTAVYKQVRAEITKDANGVITVALSAETKDRDGDVIRAKGWNLEHFLKHPVLVSSHDYNDLRKQIGEWKNVRIDEKAGKLLGTPVYYSGEGNDEADWAEKLLQRGAAAFSVGFVPGETEALKGGGNDYTDGHELLETSQVIIPSQRESLQQLAKSLRPGPVADIVNELLTEEPRRKEATPEPDDDATPFEYALRVLRGWSIRMFKIAKVGRPIGGANMDKIHTALGALHDLHDPNCSKADCPFGGAEPDADDAQTNSFPDTWNRLSETDRVLLALYSGKAMGEGDGASGGATVSDSGTHGAFDGTHTHPHAANGGPADMHDGDGHAHDHSGDGNHNHEHPAAKAYTEAELKSHSELPDSAFACIDGGGSVEDGKTRPLSLRHYPHHTASGAVDDGLLRSALSRIADPSNEQCGKAHLEAHAKAEGIGDRGDGKEFDLAAQIEKALEGVEF